LITVHQQYGAHVGDGREPAPAPPKRFYRSFPNSPNASRINLAADYDVPETSVSTLFSPSRSSTPTEDFDSDDSGPVDCIPTNDGLPVHKADEPAPSRLSIWMSGVKAALTRFWKGFNDFMTVPLWAALLSLIVALAQPLQHALKEHMQPVKGALESAGNCSIPVTLIVLGAYFYATPQRENNTKPLSRHKKHPQTLFAKVKGVFQRKPTTPQATMPGETATVIIAVASRMFITPMLLLPFLALSTRLSLQEVFDE
jgi:auxin efflux carrier family protein